MSRCSTVSQVDTQSCAVYLSGVVCVSGCALVHWRDTPCGFECLEMVQDGLEEGEFSREFGEFGGDAVDDVSDGSAVGVYGVILLLW